MSGPSYILRRFDSLTAAVDASAKGSNPEYSSHKFYGATFNLVETFDEACALSVAGWSDIRPDVDRILDPIRSKIAPTVKRRITRVRDVSGGSIDIGRAMGGDPRCFVGSRIRPRLNNGPVVRILINGGATSDVDTSRIMKRGAAISALVECLSLAGYNAEIDVIHPITPTGTGARNGRNKFATVIRVKESRDPLNIDRLMFAVAHPDMLRRIVFGLREADERAQWIGADDEKASYGYGRTAPLKELPEEWREGYSVAIDRPGDYADRMERSTEQWVTEVLASINGNGK